MDVFDQKSIDPMLIKELQEPFNSPDYIYELKLDGFRCLAYLNSDSTDLRTKHDNPLIKKFPELSEIHKQVTSKCILDGELIVTKNGVPDFYEIQRRALLTDSFKIQMAAQKSPASFVAFDILYYADKEIIDQPLIVRKNVLQSCVNENNRIAISRYIEEYGIELFNLACEKGLEGVVAKKSQSQYYYGKTTKEWVKFKKLDTDNFIICGIAYKKPMSTLILGKHNDKGDLIYKGSVSLGFRSSILNKYPYKKIPYSPFTMKEESNGITWIEPTLVCTVQYMSNEDRNSMRQPVFKGILDIDPRTVIDE